VEIILVGLLVLAVLYGPNLVAYVNSQFHPSPTPSSTPTHRR